MVRFFKNGFYSHNYYSLAVIDLNVFYHILHLSSLKL